MIPAVSAATGGGTVATLPYQWITAGSNGELYTSTSTTVANGSWTSRTSSFGTTLIRSVASNGSNLYVAVGDSGKLATSPDGISWTQRTSSFNASTAITSVAYGNGYWVATGDSVAGAPQVAYSTDGITWTQKATGASGNGTKIAWGNDLWVLGTNGSSVYTATDPTGTWTARTSTLTGVEDILYFKGQSIWLAGQDNGTTGAFASSTDGTTWTARTAPVSVTGAACAFVANTTVAAVLYPTGTLVVDIASSTNGTTWTDRTPGETGAIFVSGASDNNGLLLFLPLQTSSDGTTWTAKNPPSGNIVTLCHSSGTPSLR